MVEAPPAWVRERAIPEANTARLEHAQSGVAYLLLDQQFSSRSDGHDDWFRSSSKVTNRSGLESAGQITTTYNPAFENVGINFIHLIRDGKVIDLTRETKFRIVEQKDELDDGIVSGTLKIMANLRDVRVGDIVDFAMTTHTRTTLWPHQSYFHLSQRYSEPLAMRAVRFLWPVGSAPAYKTLNSDVVFTKRKVGDSTEWEWIATDPPAVQGESDVPAGAFQWGRIDISTIKDWAELARWATALYEGDESLPPDFEARLAAIAKTSPAPADRLTAAVRYVQDAIRYVGEELGEGSYVPRRPKMVLMRGYGDCKDKSLLLAVALGRLGIDAVPALVSTREGERLPDRLPSPLLFDHVIVRAVLDGKVLWIDPTGTHRGGRGHSITPSDLGFALPIRTGQAVLQRIEGFADHAGKLTVVERFTVDETGDPALTLQVDSLYTGARADRMRASSAASSAKGLAEGNLDFYRKRFPGLIEDKPLELRDDRDANQFTMVENYRMSRDAFTKAQIGSKLIVRAYAIQNILPDRQPNPRVQPLALSDHLMNEQTIELRVKDRALEALDDIDSKAGALAYSRKTIKLPDGLRIVYRLETGERDSVPATEAEAVYTLSDKLGDSSGIEFYLDKTPRSAPTPPGIDAATWAEIKSDVQKAIALMEKNEGSSRLDALSLLTVIGGKVPHPSPAAGMIDGLKGAILSDLKRPQAALAALQSATAQFDGNPGIFRVWIAYELDLGTSESFVRAIRRTHQAQPDVVTTLDQDWVRMAMQKILALAPDKRQAASEDLCIALAEGGWQQQPRSVTGAYMLGCATAAHSRRGELADARTGLAKNPPTRTLVEMAIDRRHQALWADIDTMRKDGFRKSLELEAGRAADAVKAKPDDYEMVTAQMRSLRALGRFQEAVAAGKALATDTARVEVVGRDAFWLVDEYATNLQALGRDDEAVTAYDGLLRLGTDRYPELASLAINRAESLLFAGRYQAALESLKAIEARDFERLNAYGKMWVWANSACALRKLNRNEEAKGAEAKVTAKPDDNWSAATLTAACRNDTKAVADMLVKRLRDPDTRGNALGLFIDFELAGIKTPLDVDLRRSMNDARALPEVQAEFAKYGRMIHYRGTMAGFTGL